VVVMPILMIMTWRTTDMEERAVVVCSWSSFSWDALCSPDDYVKIPLSLYHVLN
jgi:hypothetical protein